MKKNNSGSLGGNVTGYEKLRLIKKHLRHRPRLNWIEVIGEEFWKTQCRCGETEFVIWRKAFYCPFCGRWVRKRPLIAFGDHWITTDDVKHIYEELAWKATDKKAEQ